MDINKRLPARIAIVDNDPLALRLLTEALTQVPSCALIWVCQYGTTAIQRCLSATQTRPDVLIADMSLDDLTGDQVCAAIRRETDSIAIIGITAYPTNRYRTRMINAGAQALISKDRLRDYLATAVRQALAGRTFDPDAHSDPHATTFLTSNKAHQLLVNRQLEGNDGGHTVALSKREHEALAAYAQGLTTREIASRLHVSESTVYSYQSRAVHKLNARNVIQAVVTAVRKGLV